MPSARSAPANCRCYMLYSSRRVPRPSCLAFGKEHRVSYRCLLIPSIHRDWDGSIKILLDVVKLRKDYWANSNKYLNCDTEQQRIRSFGGSLLQCITRMLFDSTIFLVGSFPLIRTIFLSENWAQLVVLLTLHRELPSITLLFHSKAPLKCFFIIYY